MEREEVERIMWNEDLHERIEKFASKGEVIDLLIKVFRSFGQKEVACVRAELDDYIAKLIQRERWK